MGMGESSENMLFIIWVFMELGYFGKGDNNTTSL